MFDHEWGHGMDDNDTGGVLSNSSEGYADIAAIYRLQASCVGHGFFLATNASRGLRPHRSTAPATTGTRTRSAGQPTTATPTARACATPTGRSTFPTRRTPPTGFVCTSCLTGGGPCGRQVHCAAAPSRQAAWDLVTRDLRGAPFNLDSQTAFIVGNKLFYQGSGLIGSWHACTCGGTSDGCGATNGYMQWITADDDNGNLADGTPHMTAIHRRVQPPRDRLRDAGAHQQRLRRRSLRRGDAQRHGGEQPGLALLEHDPRRDPLLGLPHRRPRRMRLRQGAHRRGHGHHLRRHPGRERPAVRLQRGGRRRLRGLLRAGQQLPDGHARRRAADFSLSCNPAAP